MIVEICTDLVKPREVPTVEQRISARIDERCRLSPLGGAWKTEMGMVDQVIHLWPYRDSQHRDEVRAEAGEAPGDASYLDDLLINRETMLVQPAAFSPPIGPGRMGPIYELRIYSYEPGYMPMVMSRWEEKVAERSKMSPLIMCGHSLTGRLNQWVHLWAYEDLAQRAQVRSEARRLGVWPPAAREGLITQESSILLPLSFSPLS